MKTSSEHHLLIPTSHTCVCIFECRRKLQRSFIGILLGLSFLTLYIYMNDGTSQPHRKVIGTEVKKKKLNCAECYL